MSDAIPENTPLDIISGQPIPRHALRDFYALSELDLETCKEVAQSLHEIESSDEVPQKVRQVLAGSHPDAADALLRLLSNISYEEVEGTIELLRNWVAARTDRQEVFTEERLARFEENMRVLIEPYPLIELHQKAEVLSRAIGNEFVAAKCYCDLRPIFDEARENVDAFALLTTMKLLYVTQEGQKRFFESVLRVDQLTELRDEIDRALVKLAKLKPVGERLLESHFDENK